MVMLFSYCSLIEAKINLCFILVVSSNAFYMNFLTSFCHNLYDCAGSHILLKVDGEL